MTAAPKPGFLLVAKREWQWLLHDRAAVILIFGVPLFAFVVLTAVFSHPVIRGMGVVIVDRDRSETSRAFVEQVAASPGLSIVERAGDLASAARAIRSGEAIGAVYVPADFERDLKAERRPQVVAFYNQQYLTAAGVASSGLERKPRGGRQARGGPRGAETTRIGALVAETIVLVNPQKNYAQFLLRALLPVVIHVIIALSAGYAVGSDFAAAACGTGSPVRAAIRSWRYGQARAPVRNLLRHDADRGSDPGRIARDLIQRRRADDGGSGILADHRLSGSGCAAATHRARPRDRARPDRHRGLTRVRLRRRRISGARHECVRLRVGRDAATALVHGGIAGASGAGIAALRIRAAVRRAGGAGRALFAARVSALALAGAEPRRQRAGARTGSGFRHAARHRRRLCRGVAARAGHARRVHAPSAGADRLRLLLPAALPQPDPAQDPDRRGRRRSERAQSQDRSDAGCKRRGQGGVAR